MRSAASAAYLLTLLSLVGCGGELPDPIIDRAGVDEVQYNRDLAACHNERPAITVGAYITRCMTQRGYKVLYGHTYAHHHDLWAAGVAPRQYAARGVLKPIMATALSGED